MQVVPELIWIDICSRRNRRLCLDFCLRAQQLSTVAALACNASADLRELKNRMGPAHLHHLVRLLLNGSDRWNCVWR